jgi:hypothetical protein
MKKKIWLMVIFILIALVVLVWLMSRPAKGRIIYSKPSESNVPVRALQGYEGGYIKFQHLNIYEVRKIGGTQDSNNLENIQLVGKTGVFTGFVITLKKNPVGMLEDVSGVTMRQIKKDVYTNEKIGWGKSEGLLFTKKEPYELVAFFLKDGKSLTVAMTANGSDEKLYREEFEKLLGSIVLK